MLNQEKMIDILGDSHTIGVDGRLKNLVFLPPKQIESLASLALPEKWGKNNYCLTTYLAVHVAWSIEQGQFSTSKNQIYVTAGHLQTRYGTPIYIVLEENSIPGKQPLYWTHVGVDISSPELPVPPCIPSPPELKKDREIVISHEHILDKNAHRVPFLSQTPRVSQMCALSGAIQWSLNRGLQMPYWYYGKMSYLVPLYLQSREDITQSPDLIAPIQVTQNSLVVRTVLEPHMPYAKARVAVKRHDQLPHWMISGWDKHSNDLTESQIDNPEQTL